MKKRLREGAKLIVIDPRRIDIVRSPTSRRSYHLPLLPGTNVAMVNALSHVIVTEGLENQAYIAERCDPDGVRPLAGLHPRAGQFAGSAGERSPAFRRPRSAPPRGSMPPAAMAPSITASASPSTARAPPWSWPWPISPCSPAMSAATAWASIRCAARTMCRAPATWAPSRTSSRATAMSATTRCARCSRTSGRPRSMPSRACAFPTCSTRPSKAPSRASSCRARTSPSPIPTPST